MAMRAHQVANGGVTKQVLVQALPTQQPCHRGKGQILGQKTRPLLQSPGEDHALMGRKQGVAGQQMARLVGVGEHLARQV